MKNALLVIVSYLLLFMITGCITTTNVVPLVYTNNQNTEFEILGTFSQKSASPMGYVDVYNIAKKQYPDTDFVIDIVIDQHIIKTSYHIIVFLLKQIFSADFGKTESFRYEYVMRGTAIRYKHKIYNVQEISTNDQNNVISTRTDTLAIDIFESYTVQKVTGTVYRKLGTSFIKVIKGDILSKDTEITMSIGTSLVFNDGSWTITVPENKTNLSGKIANLVQHSNTQ
jgi:hypothetical protein